MLIMVVEKEAGYMEYMEYDMENATLYIAVSNLVLGRE